MFPGEPLGPGDPGIPGVPALPFSPFSPGLPGKPASPWSPCEEEDSSLAPGLEAPSYITDFDAMSSTLQSSICWAFQQRNEAYV